VCARDWTRVQMRARVCAMLTDTSDRAHLRMLYAPNNYYLNA
jgi:hypothetical protein